MQKLTPMLRQYLEIKKQYPGTLLFFRLGDFYELFYEDARIGSRELDITLTARHKKSSNPVPMCGVPHHSAANYIARLVKKGYRVAICEQTEEAGAGKKLVKREVARVITPGTAIDPQLVESRDPVFLAAVCGAGNKFGAAFLDLSTGDFFSTECDGTQAFADISSEIQSFTPRELLYPENLKSLIENEFCDDAKKTSGNTSNIVSISPPGPDRFKTTLTPLDDWLFNETDCEDILKEHFDVLELTGFGLEGHPLAVSSAGACLRYARETQKATAGHISDINFLETKDFMVLDQVTLDNLEIIRSRDTGSNDKRTLFGVIDATVTGMGARLLRSWLLRPSLKKSEIQTRLSAVEELTDTMFRDQIRFHLKEVSDLERLIGRLNLGTATPRDLLSLSSSLAQVPHINRTLSDAKSLLLQVLNENIFEMPELCELIDRGLADDPPAVISDGGVIREGFDQELDELRALSKSAKQTIAGFEAEEKKRTGISNLKVKFNNVFGYFIEVSKSNLPRIPEEYERRQTLTNSERFTIPKLKDWEARVLGAEEKIKLIEERLFREIRSTVADQTQKLQSTARALATLDVLAALAETAISRNYTAPVLSEGDEIRIKNGRHPIVEVYGNQPFVPNDLKMNNSTDRLLIITGANMSGKSTIMRQVALIQILGQIGSFVPADSARLPLLDRIWTRVGASDDLASGRSTFMVEMTETAAILHNATPRSLVLLDEIGRGTSTFDGLSIAWAVAEYLHDSPAHSAKTLFATHYHELTELAEKLPGAKNYQVLASEKDGDVVFLHKLAPGKASKSYGIAVAKLAGLPQKTILRARQVLSKLEQYELAVFKEIKQTDALETAAGRASHNSGAAQVSLFAITNEDVIDELRELDIGEMSEQTARQKLTELKNKII